MPENREQQLLEARQRREQLETELDVARRALEIAEATRAGQRRMIAEAHGTTLEFCRQVRVQVLGAPPLMMPLPSANAEIGLFTSWQANLGAALMRIAGELEHVPLPEMAGEIENLLEKWQRLLHQAWTKAILPAGMFGPHVEGLARTLLDSAQGQCRLATFLVAALKEAQQREEEAKRRVEAIEAEISRASRLIEMLGFELRMRPVVGPQARILPPTEKLASLRHQLAVCEDVYADLLRRIAREQGAAERCLNAVVGAPARGGSPAVEREAADHEKKLRRIVEELSGDAARLRSAVPPRLAELRLALATLEVDLPAVREEADRGGKVNRHDPRLDRIARAEQASGEALRALEATLSGSRRLAADDAGALVDAAEAMLRRIPQMLREEEQHRARKSAVAAPAEMPANPPSGRVKDRAAPAPAAMPSPAPASDPLASIGAVAFMARRERRGSLAEEIERRRGFDKAESRLLTQLDRVGEAAERARPLVSAHAAGMQAAVARLDAQIAALKGVRGRALTDGARQVGHTLGEMAALARRLGLNSAGSVRSLQRAINERRDALARLASGLPPDGPASSDDHLRFDSLRRQVPGMERVIAEREQSAQRVDRGGTLGGSPRGGLAGLAPSGVRSSLPPHVREQKLEQVQSAFQRGGRRALIDAVAPGTASKVKKLDDSLALVAALSGRGHKPLTRRWGALTSIGSGLAALARKAVKKTPLSLVSAGAAAAGSALSKVAGSPSGALAKVGGALVGAAKASPQGRALKAALDVAKQVKAGGNKASKTARVLGFGMSLLGGPVATAVATAGLARGVLAPALADPGGAAKKTGGFFKSLGRKVTGVVGAIGGKVRKGLSTLKPMLDKTLPIAKTAALVASGPVGLAALAIKHRKKLGSWAKSAWNKTKELGATASAFMQSPGGQLLSTGLSLAATFIPGGLVVKAGIGALAGAISAVAKGGGVKEALLGAVSGGIQGAVPILKMGAARKLGLGAVKGAIDAAANGGSGWDMAKGAFFGGLTMGGGAALKSWGGGRMIGAMKNGAQRSFDKGALQKAVDFAGNKLRLKEGGLHKVARLTDKALHKVETGALKKALALGGKHADKLKKLSRGMVWAYDKSDRIARVTGKVKSVGEHSQSALELISKGATFGADKLGDSRLGRALASVGEGSRSKAEWIDGKMKYVKVVDRYAQLTKKTLGVGVNLFVDDPAKVLEMQKRQRAARRHDVENPPEIGPRLELGRFERFDNFLDGVGGRVESGAQRATGWVAGGVGRFKYGRGALDKLSASRGTLTAIHGKWDALNEAVGQGIGAAEKVQDGLLYLAMVTEDAKDNPRLQWLGETAYSLQKRLGQGVDVAKGVHGISSLAQGVTGAGLQAGGVSSDELEAESERRKIHYGLKKPDKKWDAAGNEVNQELVAGSLDDELGPNQHAVASSMKRYEDLKKRLSDAMPRDESTDMTALERWQLHVKMLGESQKYGRDTETRQAGADRTMAGAWLFGADGPEKGRESDAQKEAKKRFEDRQKEREAAKEAATEPIAGEVTTIDPPPQDETDLPLEPLPAPTPSGGASKPSAEVNRELEKAAASKLREAASDEAERFEEDEKASVRLVESETGLKADDAAELLTPADGGNAVPGPDELPLEPVVPPAQQPLEVGDGLLPIPGLALTSDEDGVAGGLLPQPPASGLAALDGAGEPKFMDVASRLQNLRNRLEIEPVDGDPAARLALLGAAGRVEREIGQLRASAGENRALQHLVEKYQAQYDELASRLDELVAPAAKQEGPLFDDVPHDALSQAMFDALRTYVERARLLLSKDGPPDEELLAQIGEAGGRVPPLVLAALTGSDPRAAAFAKEVHAAFKKWRERLVKKQLQALGLEEPGTTLADGAKDAATLDAAKADDGDGETEPGLDEEPALVLPTPDVATEGLPIPSAEDGYILDEPVEDSYIGSGSAARPIADGLASGFRFGNLEPQGPTVANALAGLGGAIVGLGGSVKGAAGDVKGIGDELSLSSQAITGMGSEVGALVGAEENAVTRLGGGLDQFAGWVKQGADAVAGRAGEVEEGGGKLHGVGDTWRSQGLGRAVGQLFRKGRGDGGDPSQAPMVDASTYADAPQRLDYSVMSQMERFLGSSFSDVKIHTGKGADLVTRRFDAEAVTIREHIFFAPGRFQPQSTEGRKLLAHELTHVKQRGRPNLDTATAEEEAHRAEALYGAPGMEILDLSMPQADFTFDDGGASANPTGVFTAKRTRSLAAGSSSFDAPVEGEELLDLVGERVYELMEEELERELENR